MTLLPEGAETIGSASSFLITAVGKSGMDRTTVAPQELWPGVSFGLVDMQGKLYAETAEGRLYAAASDAVLELLDPNGAVLQTLFAEPTEGGVCFTLDGTVPSLNWRLLLPGDRSL